MMQCFRKRRIKDVDVENVESTGWVALGGCRPPTKIPATPVVCVCMRASVWVCVGGRACVWNLNAHCIRR